MSAKTVRGLVILGVAILQTLAFQYAWIPVLFAIWILIALAVLVGIAVWAKRFRNSRGP